MHCIDTTFAPQLLMNEAKSRSVNREDLEILFRKPVKHIKQKAACTPITGSDRKKDTSIYQMKRFPVKTLCMVHSLWKLDFNTETCCEKKEEKMKQLIPVIWSEIALVILNTPSMSKTYF